MKVKHKLKNTMKTTAAFSVNVIILIFIALSSRALPQIQTPVILRHIDLSSYGAWNDFYRVNNQWGDLNNDGVFADFIRYSNSRKMQAFSYSGGDSVTLLWSYTAPITLPAPLIKYHYKYTIWDIDNDGHTEVIGPFASSSGYIELRILDGETGTIERSITTIIPNPTNLGDTEWRVYVTVANFRGLSYPRDIVLLNESASGGDIWVYNDELTGLWNTTGDNAIKSSIYAHYPYTFDIDDDGKDELIGSRVFDDDGTILWRTTPSEWNDSTHYYYDHLDRCLFGDIDPSRTGNEFIVSHEWKRLKLFDTHGNIYWQSSGDSKDAQLSAVGKMTDSLPANQFVIYDDNLGGDSYLYDINGNGVKPIDGNYDGYQMDYDGNRAIDEIWIPKSSGVLFSPWTNEKIFFGKTLPWNTPTVSDSERVFGNVLDLLGDYREEMVYMDKDEFFICGAPGTAPGNYPSPWVDPEYRLMIANKQDDVHPEKKYYNWRKSFTNVTINDNVIRSFALDQAYPNPFNPLTNISFSISKQSFVSLKIFDIVGREVTTITSEELQAGSYVRQWNAEGITSGVYFYRLQADNFTKTNKLILLK